MEQFGFKVGVLVSVRVRVMGCPLLETSLMLCRLSSWLVCVMARSP